MRGCLRAVGLSIWPRFACSQFAPPDGVTVSFTPLPERTGTPAPADLVQRRSAAGAAFRDRPDAAGVRVERIELGGVPVLRCEPDSLSAPGRILVYCHGGGYRLGSTDAFRSYASHLSATCGVTVCSVDYRLAPENPFPAALNDVARVYTELLETGTDPGAILLGGDSAGGGLAAALIQLARARQWSAPAALILLSPWLDLRNTAESFQANAGTDQLFSLDAAREAADMYLAGHRSADTLASPLLGDWAQQPPTLLQVSDAEVLHDDAIRLAAAIRDAGGNVQLSVFPGVPHVWHLAFPQTPDSCQAFEEIRAFVAALPASAIRH